MADLELVALVHEDHEEPGNPPQAFRIRHAYYGPVIEWLDDAGEVKATVGFDYCGGMMQVLVFDKGEEPVGRVPLEEDGTMSTDPGRF